MIKKEFKKSLMECKSVPEDGAWMCAICKKAYVSDKRQYSNCLFWVHGKCAGLTLNDKDSYCYCFCME